MHYVLDTNAVIYLQRGQLAERLPVGSYGISVITEMELLAFSGLDQTHTLWLQQFIDSMTLIELDRNVRQCAIRFRREYRLKLPDAIIAASAMTHDAVLISNDAQLARIVGLQLHRVSLNE